MKSLVVNFIYYAFQFYSTLILIYCLLSWFPRPKNQRLVELCEAISMVVEPYVGLFKRFIPPMAGIDWSPVIAIVVLNFLGKFVLVAATMLL